MQERDEAAYVRAVIAVTKRLLDKREAGEAYIAVEDGAPDEEAVRHRYIEAVGEYKGAYELTAELFNVPVRYVTIGAAAIADALGAAKRGLVDEKGGDGDA